LGDSDAAIRVVMVRESVDLMWRDSPANIRLIEGCTDLIRPLTQNTKRKRIIPATPGVLRFKETVLEAVTHLDAVREPWMREDAHTDDFLPVMGEEQLDRFLSGRLYLHGGGSAQVEMGRLLSSIDGLESLWGSFHIWIKKRETAEIASLGRALANLDPDAEEFLEDLVWGQNGDLSYSPITPEERTRFVRTRARIAKILWNEGAGPTREYESVQELIRAAVERDRRRGRTRSIQLGGVPVVSLTELEDERLVDVRPVPNEDYSFVNKVIKALTPRELDHFYIQLKVIDQARPQEIRKELHARGWNLTDRDFNALQHRCNNHLRAARDHVEVTTSRRSRRDAIQRWFANRSLPK